MRHVAFILVLTDLSPTPEEEPQTMKMSRGKNACINLAFYLRTDLNSWLFVLFVLLNQYDQTQ